MKYLINNKNIINWLKVMRISQGFFFITAMPITLGSTLVIYHGGIFHLPVFFIIFIGSIFYHLGADLINEYYDYINNNHNLNSFKTPFSGGTNILEKKLLNPIKVLQMSYLFFFIGIIFSAIAIYLSTWWLAIFSFLGLISCWGYSAPPLKFSYRGLGEIIIFLNNGFFLIITIYLALQKSLDFHLILPSLFLGFMGCAIILMNELPDYNDDKRINKKNLVVRLGINKAIKLWKFCIIFAYLSIILACLINSLPKLCLIVLVALILPKNFKLLTTKITRQDLQSKEKMTFFCAQTIKLKFTSWQLIMLAFAIIYLTELS